MKITMTLLTFLIGMTIGSITYAENSTLSAGDQTNLDVQTITAPNFVAVPVINSVSTSDETEAEIDDDYDSEDDEC